MISKFQIKYLIQVSFSLSLLMMLSDVTTMFFAQTSNAENADLLLNILTITVTDLGVGGLFFFIFLLPHILLTKLNVTLGRILMNLFALIILIVNLGLNKYFITTHLSLGSDLFGYTLKDILMIVQTSTDFSFISLLSFILFPIAFLAINSLRFGYNFYKNGMIWPLLAGLFLLPLLQIIDIKSKTNLAYFISDSVEYKLNKSASANVKWDIVNNEFPLMKPINVANDVLGDYLNLKEEKPNIVLLVVEGLGRDFSGSNAQYPGFTPFLDSLAKESLSWSNFVSNTGRSFGALPSILGSAPFGENGFLELQNIPAHLSLISLLKENGYKTSYFEGGDSKFDNKINYLQNEGIDFILDQNNFGPGYKKIINPENGFSWGYPDSEIYKKTLTLIEPTVQPRLDVVLSISNHEPFDFPNKATYQSKAEKIRDAGTYKNAHKKTITEHLDIFSSLLYTDASIQYFLEEYKKKDNYENTIFIITGDHRLIPVPQKDQICRYHVPLIVFSPLQKKVQEFKGISSHMDITPSIITMLKNKYNAKTSEMVPWLGSNLSSSIEFLNDHEIPLMKYKGAFKDFISKSGYLSDGDYFDIDENFSLSKMSNSSTKTALADRYQYHKTLNSYVTVNDKIIPQDLAIVKTKKIIYTKDEKKLIDENTIDATLEEIYFKARAMAFDKKYDDALFLISYINQNNPNHFDARTLKGRIYAWNSEYEQAQKELLFVINRSPLYSDAYSAIMDLYWWNDKYIEALEMNEKIQANFSDRKDFIKKMDISMARFDPADFKNIKPSNELKGDLISKLE
jgi:lipoteichoic acid synthase